MKYSTLINPWDIDNIYTFTVHYVHCTCTYIMLPCTMGNIIIGKLAAVGHYIEFIVYTHSSTIHEIHVTVYTRARHMHARTHA